MAQAARFEQAVRSKDRYRKRRRRGLPGQQELRRSERSARRRAAQLLARRGLTLRAGAQLLGVPSSTLLEWANLEAKPSALGRRPRRGAAEHRDGVLRVLRELGARAGLPRVMALCPEVPRNELRELIRRYRGHLRAKPRQVVEREVLVWQVPGAAWAMDFTEIKDLLALEQRPGAKKALVVRGLASRYTLALEPAPSEQAALVVRVLEREFVLRGAPYVLKLDNGPGFVAQEVKELCERYDVLLLYSPSYCPSYNGAIEASNSWIKLDLAHLAQRFVARSVAELLAATRDVRNTTGRPWGAADPTPAECWEARSPLCEETRARLLRGVKLCATKRRCLRELAKGAALSHTEVAEIGRQIIPRALVEHGILAIRRRRVSL